MQFSEGFLVGPSIIKAFINNLQLPNKRHPLIKDILGYNVNQNVNRLMVLLKQSRSLGFL